MCGSSWRLQLLSGALVTHAALRQRSRWSAQRCVGHEGWSQGPGARCVGWGALWSGLEKAPDGEALLLRPAPSPPANTYSLETVRESHSTPLTPLVCLENPRDWGAWWAAVSGVTQSRPQLKRLSSIPSLVPWGNVVLRDLE